MNILQVQDDLKNFSQQQLIQEMKQPKGIAPQFLVLGEITRRKRMSDDMKTRGAADQKTVAQEVVSAAGVPQGGLAQMSQSMAPKSSIEPNMQPPSQAQLQAPMTMASGGILSLAAGGKTKKEKAFFLEFPKNSPIFAGERRYVTANTLSKLEASMPLFFKRMRSRGEIIANENAPEAFQKTATKLAPAQLNVAMRRGKENIARAEEAARIAELQAETGATDDQAVTSAGSPTESQVIDEVQSLDAPVDYEEAEKERLRQEALATGLVPSQTTSQIRDVNSGVRPFRGSAFPSLADMKPYPTTNTPVFNATSDEAAVASAEEIKKQEAFKRARENARAYAEGRTPKQENQQERDRRDARDSAITALGQIDRSNEPVGFRQIMENKALQQAAIAQANPNMFGDLGAPNTMQEELARKAAEDEAAKEAQAEAQLQSYLRNMEAPTDMIGGIRESDLVREMRESNEMANQAKIDQILSGGSQGMDFNANLASPELDENVARAIINRQRREAAERVALKDATGKSIKSAAPIGNYGQVAADALRADVGVRDAGLGGAFAKGDEGIERKFGGFGPFQQSTSEIIQDRLDQNAIDDEVARIMAPEEALDQYRKVSPDRTAFGNYASEYDRLRGLNAVDPYAADRAAIASSDTDLRDSMQAAIGDYDNSLEGIRAMRLRGGELFNAQNALDQYYDPQTYEESPTVTAPYYKKPTLRELGLMNEYGQMIDSNQSRAEIATQAREKVAFDKQAEAERKAFEGTVFRSGDPLMFGSDTPDLYPEGTSFINQPFLTEEANARNIRNITEADKLDNLRGEGYQEYMDAMDQMRAEGLNMRGPDKKDIRNEFLSNNYRFRDPTKPYFDVKPSSVTGFNDAMLQYKSDLDDYESGAVSFGGYDGPVRPDPSDFAVPSRDNVMRDDGTAQGIRAGLGANLVRGDIGIKPDGSRLSALKEFIKPENDPVGTLYNTNLNSVQNRQYKLAAEDSLDDDEILSDAEEKDILDAYTEAGETQTQAAQDGTTSDTSLAGSIDEAVNTGAAANALPTVRDTDDSKGGTSTKSGTGSSASSQIIDLLKSQEANADSDKWLALANAGMALMSSKQPTLGGALGEAGQVGIAGLMKSRQAADAAKLKTLKFQAGLEAAAAKAALPKDRYKSDVSLYNNTTDNIRGLLTQKGASSSTDFLNAVEGTGPDEISKEDKAQLVYLIRMQREAARRLGYDNPPPVKKIS